MGAIADAFVNGWRDYTTDGVPASGAHKPEKPDLRALGTLIENSIAAVGLGSMIAVIKTTRANLNADLNFGANTVALVYADATNANNDLYVKSGGSGTGSWTLTNSLHSIAEAMAAPSVALAQEWAENPEDDPVTGFPGEYSALHWAAKAAALVAPIAALQTAQPALNRAWPFVDMDVTGVKSGTLNNNLSDAASKIILKGARGYLRQIKGTGALNWLIPVAISETEIPVGTTLYFDVELETDNQGSSGAVFRAYWADWSDPSTTGSTVGTPGTSGYVPTANRTMKALTNTGAVPSVTRPSGATHLVYGFQSNGSVAGKYADWHVISVSDTVHAPTDTARKGDAVAIPVAMQARRTATVHISPSGIDGDPNYVGTTNRPFATPQYAQEAMIANGIPGPYTILAADGDYILPIQRLYENYGVRIVGRSNTAARPVFRFPHGGAPINAGATLVVGTSAVYEVNLGAYPQTEAILMDIYAETLNPAYQIAAADRMPQQRDMQYKAPVWPIGLAQSARALMVPGNTDLTSGEVATLTAEIDAAPAGDPRFFYDSATGKLRFVMPDRSDPAAPGAPPVYVPIRIALNGSPEGDIFGPGEVELVNIETRYGGWYSGGAMWRAWDCYAFAGAGYLFYPRGPSELHRCIMGLCGIDVHSPHAKDGGAAYGCYFWGARDEVFSNHETYSWYELHDCLLEGSSRGGIGNGANSSNGGLVTTAVSNLIVRGCTLRGNPGTTDGGITLLGPGRASIDIRDTVIEDVPRGVYNRNTAGAINCQNVTVKPRSGGKAFERLSASVPLIRVRNCYLDASAGGIAGDYEAIPLTAVT